MNFFRDDGIQSGSGLLLKQYRFTAPPDQPQYLLACEAKLLNAGVFVHRFGRISLTNIDGKSNITLEMDNFGPKGTIGWQGCIPVSSGQMAEFTFFGTQNNDAWTIVYITSDVPVPNGGFNYQNATAIYPLGSYETGIVTGAAATEATDFRPPGYTAWELLKCYAYHDDTGGNRACTITVRPSTGQAVIIAANAALANNINLELFDASVHQPFIITREYYLTFNVASIGAGKKGYIVAYYRVFEWAIS